MSSAVNGATPVSRPVDRRRQRSTRLVVAASLVGVAALVVLVAVIAGSVLGLSLAAIVAVCLGAAATRMVHTEVMQSRRDAARDLAKQAHDYARLDSIRVTETKAFADSMRKRIGALEDERVQWQQAFEQSEANVATARARADRAEGRADTAERQLAATEDRAAEAIVRLMELEQELDVLQSQYDAVQAELHAWQGNTRRHA